MHNCTTVRKHSKPVVTKIPTRLLEVKKDGVDTIHLVETRREAVSSDRYIAFSHCWGKLRNSERFCLHSSNLSELKKYVDFEALPKSFQDAIRVTRALGIQYLWIDSLCIIQDDEDDWAAEAGKMEDVFSEAYCTIAASSAESSLAGFLGGRKSRDVIGISTPGGEPLYLAEYIDDFCQDVENSVLSTRGWVLQERTLSRRTIYFTSTQVYWECDKGVVCESLAQLYK